MFQPSPGLFAAAADPLTLDHLRSAPAWLPEFLLRVDLIRAFFVYLLVMLVVSLALRLRFYKAVYEVATYFASNCPTILTFLNRHFFRLTGNGIYRLLYMYGGFFAVYLLVTRVVIPGRHLFLSDFVGHPGLLTAFLAVGGAMVALDVALVSQVAVLDAQQIKTDLAFAEGWLGGRVASVLNLLGTWNPLRYFADRHVRNTMEQFNGLFRTNLGILIVQLALRLLFLAIILGAFFTARVVEQRADPTRPAAPAAPAVAAEGR